jgi:putative FmdB family regulatory protein
MPTYSYRCPKCGNEYDAFQKMSDEVRARCPRCGTRGDRQISGGAGLVFKGSGFYVTDYKRSGAEKADGPPETSEKPSEKKKKPDAATPPSAPDKKPGADS